MTTTLSLVDQIVKIQCRHRFHPVSYLTNSLSMAGFCGGPYCGSNIVTIDAHERHVAEAILVALQATTPTGGTA